MIYFVHATSSFTSESEDELKAHRRKLINQGLSVSLIALNTETNLYTFDLVDN